VRQTILRTPFPNAQRRKPHTIGFFLEARKVQKQCGGTGPCILDLGTRWMEVVSFILLLLFFEKNSLPQYTVLTYGLPEKRHSVSYILLELTPSVGSSSFPQLIACNFSQNTISTLAHSYYRNKLRSTNLTITVF
jgi:hypothetical protein